MSTSADTEAGTLPSAKLLHCAPRSSRGIAATCSCTAHSDEACVTAAERFGTPLYLYSSPTLVKAAKELLLFPNAFGLTVRYAMKACSNAAILKIISDLGLHIDASSTYEAYRALAAGIPASKICISSQELQRDFADLVHKGVEVWHRCLTLERYNVINPVLGEYY